MAKKKAVKKTVAKKAPKTKKSVKKVAVSKPFEQPKVVPVKKSIIEHTEPQKSDEYEHEPVYVEVEKVPFYGMCDILHCLSHAFMKSPEDEPTERFFAAWHSCLAIAGWVEEEFWIAYDYDDACPVCGDDMGGEDEIELPKAKVEPNKLAN
jgi:hypothetical protein